MFRQAAQLDIPFHEWHFWIVDRFSEKLKEYQMELAKKGVVIGLKEDGGPSNHQSPSKTTHAATRPTPAMVAKQLPPPPQQSSAKEEEGSLSSLWKSIFK